MSTQFPEYVSTSNNLFVFHKSTEPHEDIVRYDLFCKDMEKIAVVRFLKTEEIVCQLLNLKDELIATIDNKNVININEGEITSIWKSGFNYIAEIAAKKLKVKNSK